MIGYGYIVKNDLFDISRRLKEIDESYYVVYSYRNNRYEVHSDEQKGSSLAVVLPFDRLDCRSINHVLKTRRENSRKLLLEIDRDNAEAERETVRKMVKDAEYKAERALRGTQIYE